MLTPEEWVRQHVVHYMIQLGYPAGLMAVERMVRVHLQSQRADIVVYNRSGKPVFLVECKSTDVEISQEVFDQVARYNMPLQVNWLMVTNGLQHYVCEINYAEKSYRYITALPLAEQVVTS